MCECVCECVYSHLFLLWCEQALHHQHLVLLVLQVVGELPHAADGDGDDGRVLLQQPGHLRGGAPGVKEQQTQAAVPLLLQPHHRPTVAWRQRQRHANSCFQGIT